MKKLLFILLLLLCQRTYSQITITRITASGEHNCAGTGLIGVTHNNIPLDAGNLYIAVVFSDSSTNYGINITGTSFTWDTVLQIQSFRRRIAIYRCMPTSSTTTDDPQAAFSFGSYPNNIDFLIYKVTGVPLGNNGANAISQVAVDSATASANPSISTMAAIPGNAGVMALFINNSTSFSGTAESGWTESWDNGCSTFAGATYVDGVYVEYRVSTNDNTPTVTAASSNWIGAALEFKGGRRIIITN